VASIVLSSSGPGAHQVDRVGRGAQLSVASIADQPGHVEVLVLSVASRIFPAAVALVRFDRQPGRVVMVAGHVEVLVLSVASRIFPAAVALVRFDRQRSASIDSPAAW
jgi:hypothetical protein